MKKYFLHIILLINFFAVAQKTPTVSVKIDTTKIRIGEQINYQITVDDAENGVIFPKLNLDSLGKIEIVTSLNVDTLKNRLIKKYILTSFDSGSYVIPKQSIYIWNQPYYTDSVLINVATVAVDTLKQKMYPIKAIQNEPYTFDDFKSYLWWILGTLLLIALILYFVLRKKETQEEIEARIPPYQLALTRLKALDEKQLWQKNKIKKYYVELTDIVRSYIERELKIPALESTTDELMETMTDFNASSSLNIPEETIKKLQKLLKEADLVKFAKFKPLANEIELHRNDAGTIVDGIKTTRPVVDEVENFTQIEESKKLEEKRTKNSAIDNKSWWKIKDKKKLIVSAIALLIIIFFVTIGKKLGKQFINSLKSNNIEKILDKKWHKSSYGNPFITLETPEILTQKKIEIPKGYEKVIEEIYNFESEDKANGILISLATTKFIEKIEDIDIDKDMSAAISDLQTKGIVIKSEKRRSIFFGDNVEALRVDGQLDIINQKSTKKRKIILIMIEDENGLRQINIIFKEGNSNLEKIIERIINSIEIEDEAVE